MPIIKPIQTNVITGFLGVGKSTAILHLAKSKPVNERWAILVNEFGEVGIDGSIFKGNKDKQQDLFISEVPGGCMCCTAGLPMQIALNMLIAKAKPDRLLIEPTGLGHPKEVLSVLSSKHYKKVLDIQKTITLVDARKLDDARYTGHQIFQQQLEFADVIVGNKKELYINNEYQHLKTYIQDAFPQHTKEFYQVSNGEISLSWLAGSSSFLPDSSHHHKSGVSDKQLPPSAINFPQTGFVSVKNQGEGYFSQGWIFKPELTFNRDKLDNLFFAENIERLKAVFITNEGVIAFNKSDNVLTQITLNEAADSRIELIAIDKIQHSEFELKLLSCLS